MYRSSAGNTIVDANGSVGGLFSVTDSLTGDIMIVSDISGIPILTVNSDEYVTVDGTLITNSFLYAGLTTNTVVATIPDTKGNAAFFDYYVKDANSYMRAGTITAVWDSTSDTVEWDEVCTIDLGGSTSAVTFTVAIASNSVNVTAVIASGKWTVKIGARLI